MVVVFWVLLKKAKNDARKSGVVPGAKRRKKKKIDGILLSYSKGGRLHF